MPKRLTVTEKWADPWFSDLPLIPKLLFVYVCDTCDCAGFHERNDRLTSFQTGIPKEDLEGAYKVLDRSLIGAINGHHNTYWLKNFIKHQNGLCLDPTISPQWGVIKRLQEEANNFPEQDFSIFIQIPWRKGWLTLTKQFLNSYKTTHKPLRNPYVTLTDDINNKGYETVNEPFSKGLVTLQDKDKDKGQDKEGGMGETNHLENKPKDKTELIEYCHFLGWAITSVEADTMMDYYAPPGGDGVWRDRDGKTVCDWRAKVVGWKANQKAKQFTRSSPTESLDGKQCKCGRPADGSGRDDNGAIWYWCKICQKTLYEKWLISQGKTEALTSPEAAVG